MLPVIAETQYLSGQRRLSQEFRSHTEQLEKFIASQETRLKQLRQKQSALKTSHTDSVQQRELYHALRSLMEVKLRSVQEQVRQSANDQQEHNFMSVDQGF
jgi:membrane protein involved in colicin uptake